MSPLKDWQNWTSDWTSFFFQRGGNKQAAEEIYWFPSLKLSKHEIVWKQYTRFLNLAET